MAHPDDFEFNIEQGCRVMDGTLGAIKMPEGYHLMLDADECLFFWQERATGIESAPCWDKWVVRRGAVKRAATAPAPAAEGRE